MELLVAVKSSFPAMLAGEHDRVRGSWGQQFRGKAHVKFFIGRTTQELGGIPKSLHPSEINSYISQSDEVIVEAPDRPTGDVKKVRRMCGFIAGKNISHVMLVNIDSSVDVGAALAVPCVGFDYAGTFEKWGNVGPRAFIKPDGETVMIERCHDFAKGEAGVFLSRKAALEIAYTAPNPALYVAGTNWDLWIGQVIGSLMAEESFLTLPINPIARKI